MLYCIVKQCYRLLEKHWLRLTTTAKVMAKKIGKKRANQNVPKGH